MKQRTIILNTNCYHAYSLDDALDGAVKAGFHHIELTATKGWTEHVFPSMTFEKLCRIQEKIEALEIDVPAMSGHCNLRSSDRLEDFRDNIRLASFFGAKYIVSSVGEAHLKNNQESTDDELVANIKGLLPLLDEKQMSLVIETHGKEGTGVQVDRIIKKINANNVKINYDTANVIFYGGVKDTTDLKACIDDVAYLHIKDKAGEPKEWNFPALGKGYVPFPEIFTILDEHNNQAPLSLEIEFTKEGAGSKENVDQAVKESADYLRSLGYVL